VESANALTELLAAVPAVEVAAVFGQDGEPLGAVGVSDGTAAAHAGRTLLAAASAYRGVGEPIQVHASLGAGDVFVVGRQREPAIVAVTAAGQPSGLVFHQLKRCLAASAGVEAGL
jgi:hypothetical protein